MPIFFFFIKANATSLETLLDFREEIEQGKTWMDWYVPEATKNSGIEIGRGSAVVSKFTIIVCRCYSVVVVRGYNVTGHGSVVVSSGNVIASPVNQQWFTRTF